MIIDFFVLEKKPTDKGDKIFLTNEKEQLALAPNTEPYTSIEIGTTVKLEGEWKQGKNRQYFNATGGVSGATLAKPPSAESALPPSPPPTAQSTPLKIEIDARAKNTALMCANDLAKVSQMKPSEVTDIATLYLNWLRKE